MGREPLTSGPTTFERCYHNSGLGNRTKLGDSLLTLFVGHVAVILTC